MGAKVILVATPIGNLEDLSPRAKTALETATAWIVEDSRVSAKLALSLGLKKPLHVVNEHTTPAAIQKLVAAIPDGSVWAMVTDAGTPGISDPGALVCEFALQSGAEIDAVPGPSAPILALSMSGFFAQRFAFLGYLGRKPGDIRKELTPFQDSPFTLVMFESPYRFRQLLAVAHEVLGARRYIIARELTKVHQQIYRGVLGEALSEADVIAKGEFTIVIEGRRKSR